MEGVSVLVQLLITISTQNQHPSHGGDLLSVHLLGEELAAGANHLPWRGSLLPGPPPAPTSAEGSSPVDFDETWPSANPAKQEGWESHLEGNVTTKLSRLVFLRDCPLYLLPLIYLNCGHPGTPAPGSVQTACLHVMNSLVSSGVTKRDHSLLLAEFHLCLHGSNGTSWL